MKREKIIYAVATKYDLSHVTWLPVASLFVTDARVKLFVGERSFLNSLRKFDCPFRLQQSSFFIWLSSLRIQVVVLADNTKVSHFFFFSFVRYSCHLVWSTTIINMYVYIIYTVLMIAMPLYYYICIIYCKLISLYWFWYNQLSLPFFFLYTSSFLRSYVIL